MASICSEIIPCCSAAKNMVKRRRKEKGSSSMLSRMEHIETDGVNIIDEDRRCQAPRTMVFPTADNDEERSIKDRGVSKKIEKMA